MSNKTQLQTNNTALDEYITRINAAKEVAAGLPEAGGSGGANIETCTVTISKTTSKGDVYLNEYTIFDGQSLRADYFNNNNLILSSDSSGSYTINNVIIGTLIHLYGSASIPEWTFDDAIEELSKSNLTKILRINGNATISFADVD